jgi:hypothetical protein
LLFHSVLASLVRDSCRHVVYVARSSLSLGWALLRASARPGRAKPGHSPLSTASRGCFSYCRQFAKTGCAAALPQQEKNNSEDLQRDRAYITGFILAVESQPSPRCTFNGFESLAVASRRRNRKFEPLLLRLRLRTLTLTLNPPLQCSGFCSKLRASQRGTSLASFVCGANGVYTALPCISDGGLPTSVILSSK